MDHLSFLCLVFLLLSCLFIATSWSPAWKGLSSWLLLLMFIVYSTKKLRKSQKTNEQKNTQTIIKLLFICLDTSH